jgi:hypothetical protein
VGDALPVVTEAGCGGEDGGEAGKSESESEMTTEPSHDSGVLVSPTLDMDMDVGGDVASVTMLGGRSGDVAGGVGGSSI